MISYYLTADLNPQAGAPSGAVPLAPAVAADADIVFSDVADWVIYCDSIPKRRRAKIGTLGDKMVQEGFFEIDQLIGSRISHIDLAQSLGIGVGLAALIVRFAEEDVAQVRTGTFNMNKV